MEDLFTENSFYYFYSTVPQVLAGGIALIGAFLIFFITESNKKMLKILRDTWIYIAEMEPYAYRENIINCVRDKYKIDLEYIEYIEKKNYSEIFERIKECFKEQEKVFMRYYKRFKLELNLKSDITTKGIKAVILSGILMAISILILPFVQVLIKFLPPGIFITVLIIGFSCYAIYLIANVVISAIRKL